MEYTDKNAEIAKQLRKRQLASDKDGLTALFHELHSFADEQYKIYLSEEEEGRKDGEVADLAYKGHLYGTDLAQDVWSEVIIATNKQNRGINNGQSKTLVRNVGKKVEVLLPSGEHVELWIHNATIFQGHFRYVMHKAKTPRSTYDHDDHAIHANAKKGWFTVEPHRIILTTIER